MIVHGDQDTVVPEESVEKLVKKLSSQKGIEIDYRIIPGADHFFTEHLDQLVAHVENYLEISGAGVSAVPAAG
jgi:hypothetical protein